MADKDKAPENPFRDQRPTGPIDPSLNILREESSSKSPRELELQIQKLNQLKDALRTTSKEYAQAEAAIKKYTAALVKTRTEKSQLTNAAQKLISTIGTGGTAGTFTKFTDVTANLGTSINKTTGFMQVFGAQTTMTTGAFAGWVAAIQLGVVLLGKYLDFQDKAQKRQGELQRAFGSTNVSIGESFKAAASGWSVAGKTGEETAEQLNYIARQARGTLMTELMSGKKRMGMTPFERMIALTAGVSKKVPEYVEMLTTAFGVRGAKDLEENLTKVLSIAVKSGAPIDMMADMIFKLGQQYVFLGGSAEDAASAMMMVKDAIGKTKLPPALAQRFMQVGMEEQMTAGGLQGRFLTTTFASRLFGTFPQELQNVLNNAASKMGYTGFQTMPFMRRAELMGTLPPPLYLETKRAELNFARNIAQTQGEPVATAITQQLTGMEFKQFDDLIRKVDEGRVSQDEAVKELEASKTTSDKATQATNELLGYAKTVAEQDKEFYSDLKEALKNLQAGFITFTDALLYGEKGFRLTEENAKNVTGAFEETVREHALTGKPLTQEEVNAMVEGAGPRLKAAYVLLENKKFEMAHTALGAGAFKTEHIPFGLPVTKSTEQFIVPEKTSFTPVPGVTYEVSLILKQAKNPAASGTPSEGTQNLPGESSYKIR